jgi:rod shape-determining protein MreC
MREFLARHRRVVVASIGILLPLFLLYVHGRYPRKTTVIEVGLMTVTAPAQKAAKGLVSGIAEVWDGYIALVDLAADNEALTGDVARLQRAADQKVVLETENARLRAELEFKKARRDLILASAHVIGKDLSPYGRVIRIAIDVGADVSISEGMPVVSAMGLVGRVLRVAGNHAEVLLTVDARSTVNVRVLDKGVIGTVTGTSSPYNYVARMSYLHRAATLEVDDLLITSGHDKLFPPGLHVGTIRSIEERQRGLEYELQVSPSVNFADLEVVQVVLGVVEGEPVVIPPTQPTNPNSPVPGGPAAPGLAPGPPSAPTPAPGGR